MIPLAYIPDIRRTKGDGKIRKSELQTVQMTLGFGQSNNRIDCKMVEVNDFKQSRLSYSKL